VRRNATLFVLISLFDGFGSTAMGLSAGLWLLDLTHSVPLAALAGICTYAPTFLGPWIGAVVDRLPRRPLMVVGEATTALLLLILLTVHGARTAWLVFAVLLARGVLGGLVDAGETAILPSALPPAALGSVNGWRSSALEGTKLLAPLAGAGLYAWQGPTPVILLCAALPLITALCYLLLKLPRSTPEPPHSPTGDRDSTGDRHPEQAAKRTEATAAQGTDARPDSHGQGVWAGVALLFRLPSVRIPVLVAAVAIAMSGLSNAAVLAHIVDDLHLPSSRLGLVTSAQGAGSIFSGLLVGRLLTRLGPTRVAVLGAVLFGAGRLTWAVPWFPPALAGSVVIGLGLPWTLIAGITAIQTETPDHLLGRAAAGSNTVMFGPVAAAIPLGSAMVHLGALPPTLLAAALAFAAAAYGTRARRTLGPPGRTPDRAGRTPDWPARTPDRPAQPPDEPAQKGETAAQTPDPPAQPPDRPGRKGEAAEPRAPRALRGRRPRHPGHRLPVDAIDDRPGRARSDPGLGSSGSR
jgi:MFS family permease